MAGFLDFLTQPNTVAGERSLNSVAGGVDAAARGLVTFGYLQNGANAKRLADFQSEQLQQQANDAMGSAQRRAFSDDRQARYVQSETLARAAASGGGASDPTVVRLIAQQAAEGSYRQQVDLYEGSSRSRLLQLQAQAKQYEAGQEQESDDRKAAVSAMGVGGSLLKSYEKDSSILKRFGNGGPQLSGVGMAGGGGGY